MEQKNAFDQWMVFNREANKVDLQLLNYALLQLKKSYDTSLEAECKILFKPSDFSIESRKVSCDYVSVRRSIDSINTTISDIGLNFLQSCLYNDFEKNCEFYFTQDASFFVESRQNRLISSKRLQDSLYLRTLISIRLFNYLSKWRYEKKTAFIPIDELKYNLGLEEDSYMRFERFRSCIIEKCLDEINHYTHFKIAYGCKTGGVGGKVQAVRFHTLSKTL